MRKDQVADLLEHTKNKLTAIEKEYNVSLKEKEIKSDLQIDVKNTMENLRSVLDYIAHDIYENAIQPHRARNGLRIKSRICFPYGKDRQEFEMACDRNLSNLGTLNPNLFSVIESIQPHAAGESWLYDFCKIINENKHNSLTPQIKEEKRGLKIQFPGGTGIAMGPGASISGSGIISSGNSRIVLDGDVISGDGPATNVSGPVEQTITRWVSFKFVDTNIVILPFLKKSLLNIKDLFSKVYSEIG